MVSLKTFDDMKNINNNEVGNKEEAEEKEQCVPYAWLYVNYLQIENYIEKHLTDSRGIVDKEELEDKKYLFYVSIVNKEHPHVKIDKNDNWRRTYERNYVEGGNSIEGSTTIFRDDKLKYLSIRELRDFYFNIDVPLRLKNRLVNEISNGQTSEETVREFNQNRTMRLVSDDQNMLMKNMYADVIMKLEWAEDDHDGKGLPEWYHPFPETANDILSTINKAVNLLRTKLYKETSTEKEIKRHDNIKPEFRNKT